MEEQLISGIIIFMQNFLNIEVLSYITVALFILVTILLFWVWRITSHYNNLTKSSTKKTLTQVLEGIQKTTSQHEKKMGKIAKNVKSIEQDALEHVQDIKLKRFNPFSDTGGDQSFILSILDGNKDGVVITSLHSRENTRFYVKSVSGGEGSNHSLSEEEQKLVNSKKR